MAFSGKLSLSYLLTRNLTVKIGANYTHNMFRSDTTRRTNSISGNISCTYSFTRRMKCLANPSFTPVNSGWYRSTVKSEIAGPVLSVSIGYIFGHAKGEK